MLDNILKKISHVKSRSKVGLDIGSYSMKIVEILEDPANPKLLAIGLKKVQTLSKQGMVDAIKALADEAKISAKDLNVSISGPSVIVRFISMPKMSSSDLKSAVKFEAEKFIPFNINDCLLDFQILKTDEKGKKVDMILVAAKKDQIDEKIGMVEAAGFSVSLIDVDSFAVVNSFCRNYRDIGPDKTAALLNIGAKFTDLSIIQGGIPCLVRDVAIGNDDFDAAVSKALAIDIGSVENLRLSPQEREPDIIAAVKPIFNNMLDEVRLSCSYCENQFGRNVDEFYLSGGGAAFTGLEKVFQDMMDSKPNYWNPLKFLDTSSPNINKDLLDKNNNTFAVSVGLALR